MTVNQYVLRAWTLNPLAKNNISTTKNYSIYGRATAHVNDRLTFVGGLRYNWDKIGWNVAQYFNPAAGRRASMAAAALARAAIRGTSRTARARWWAMRRSSSSRPATS